MTKTSGIFDDPTGLNNKTGGIFSDFTAKNHKTSGIFTDITGQNNKTGEIFSDFTGRMNETGTKFARLTVTIGKRKTNMPANDYFPTTDALQNAWLINFRQKFGQYQTQLGFVDTDATALNTEVLTFQYEVARNNAVKEFARNVAARKRAMIDGRIGTTTPVLPVAPVNTPPVPIALPGIIARIRLLVNRIKASPAYTESIGKDFDIVTVTPPAPDDSTVQPNLTLTRSGGFVTVKYTKGTFAGIQLQLQREGETGWTNIGAVVAATYTDRTPKLSPNAPEIRRYRAMFLRSTGAVGQWSEAESILLP